VSDEALVPGELAIGDHPAGYRLDEIIARGGMGVIDRACDEPFGRSVALKVLAAPLARDEAVRRRFIRESRIAAAVNHPNIGPILDARRPALTGFRKAGTTPRQLALEPGGGTLLVIDTGSGQVQADEIAHLP
jgi:serine/threonine protein kinase